MTDERAPRSTDDRRPVAVGLILWIAATVVTATVAAIREIPSGILWTCIAGLILGVAGLIYVTRRSG